MLSAKVYLYDSTAENYRGEDFSKYLLQGWENTEKLNEELDVSNITLQGLTRKEEFLPATKFIIEEYLDNGDEPINIYERVVQQDTVSQPILSDNNYFTHTIALIEPSVIAQKKLVDNISVTYKLKDVNLETQVQYDTNETAKTNYVDENSVQADYEFIKNTEIGEKISFGKVFTWTPARNDDYFVLVDEDGDFSSNKKYIDVRNLETDGYKCKFALPKPRIYLGLANTNEYRPVGYASFDWTVIERDLKNNETNRWTGSHISNDDLSMGGLQDYIYTYSRVPASENLNNIKKNWLIERIDGGEGPARHPYECRAVYLKKYTDDSGSNFINQNLYTDVITITPDMNYEVSVAIHNFDDNLPNVGTDVYKNVSNEFTKYETFRITFHAHVDYGVFYESFASINNLPFNNTQFSTSYFLYYTESPKAILASGIPYDALSLLQKAIINSGNYEKIDGVACNEINNESFNCPFYIDPDFQETLSLTQVNETFFSQKNLWEILIEVGKYIHAIPELKFGKNDKFMITFNELGRTDEKENKSAKTSIVNFRGIDDYVSACSSYVSNMVQLGGTIEETIVCKTSDENALVYNDKAIIETINPIIELIKLEVICASDGYADITKGSSADMTSFIYEKNVYDLLSILPTDIPNKGIALYYQLGNNKIEGGQFQTPQASTTAYSDYAIKKVIYMAYFNSYVPQSGSASGKWSNIKVNDFVFKITYRTKDNVRETHIRPDLRKYLLNSKFEYVPQYNQFNNQEEILVDSFSFGSNVYGKLIKTGNTNYTITYWDTDPTNLKHKGELYRINNDLYYVSTVKTTYFADHYVSTVEYSKDYNQLSQIIGIPSEPRFYEISEQSSIKRDRVIEDYLLIDDDVSKFRTFQQIQNGEYNGFLFNIEHLKDLILSNGTSFAKYVVSTFKGDKDNFSPEVFGELDTYIDIITPINAYSSGTTLTYKWQAKDNFAIGDKVGEEAYTINNTADNSYRALKAVQYTDKYGKVPLYDFYIISDMPNLTAEQIRSMPESPIKTKPLSDGDTTNIYIKDIRVDVLATNVKNLDTNYNGRGLIDLKDCREAINHYYNLSALTGSDTFVISPFFFTPNKDNVRVVLLAQEVNKITNGFIPASAIIKPTNINGVEMANNYISLDENNIYVRTETNAWGKNVSVDFGIKLGDLYENLNENHFGESETSLQKVKAIAIIFSPLDYYSQKFILARNIPKDWNKAKALATWWFGQPNYETFFTNRQ